MTQIYTLLLLSSIMAIQRYYPPWKIKHYSPKNDRGVEGKGHWPKIKLRVKSVHLNPGLCSWKLRLTLAWPWRHLPPNWETSAPGRPWSCWFLLPWSGLRPSHALGTREMHHVWMWATAYEGEAQYVPGLCYAAWEGCSDGRFLHLKYRKYDSFREGSFLLYFFGFFSALEQFQSHG